MSPLFVVILLIACVGVECRPEHSKMKVREAFPLDCGYSGYYNKKTKRCETCRLHFFFNSDIGECEAQDGNVAHCETHSCNNGEECQNWFRGITCKCPRGKINNRFGQCERRCPEGWNFDYRIQKCMYKGR